MRVGIIDYGVGNLGSVVRALEELRVTPKLIDQSVKLHAVDCLILPGVGNFADCASLLRAGGWVEALEQEVKGYERPILGICVGMQLLADSSSEGIGDKSNMVSGLGFIPGQVKHLRSLGCKLRVPHVGWNGIFCDKKSHLFNEIPNGTDFYFVHSYTFVPEDQKHIIATTEYSISIAAAVKRDHIWGTQFHPEKSSRAGFKLLNNFIECSNC